jgi:hypothetical protein
MTALPMSPRLAPTEQRYKNAKEGGQTISLLDETPIKDFKYFKIIENSFPYDAIAKTHHMLVIKRECSTVSVMTQAEKDELEDIKISEFTNYHCIIENYQARSITAIWHVHLVDYLDNRPEWLS